MNLPAVSLACLLVLPAQSTGRSTIDSEGLHTGKALQQALEQTFSASWHHVALRTILSRIGGARRIAILLDRRIDPTREMTVSATGEELYGFFEKLAAKNSAGVYVIGNAVYIGNRESGSKLRTLVARRRGEILDNSGNIPARRQFELTRPTTIHWDDLTTPADLLARITKHFGLRIDNPPDVPHDLWAGGLIPEGSAAELLSLVLIQFDRAFEWTTDGTGIRIVSIPDRVFIERRHEPPHDTTIDGALAAWRNSIPGLDCTIVGNRILVRGTVEEHEAVERLRRSKSTRAPGKETAPKVTPLSQERFNLRSRAKVSSLMQKLSEPGTTQLMFEYDLDELRSSGISLDTLVSVELRDATVEELLHAIFDPLKITFELDNRVARLKVKSP